MDFGIKSNGFSIKSLLPPSNSAQGAATVVQDPAEMVESFAKLLVAQVTNQDPDKPVDPTEIISQNASFTASIATARLSNQMAHYQQVGAVLSSIGKNAIYEDPSNGSLQTGVIEGGDFSLGTPAMIIGGNVVPLENILEIDAPADSIAVTQGFSRANRMAMLGRTVEWWDGAAVQTGTVTDVDLVSAGPGYVTIDGVTSVIEGDILRVFP